MNKETYEALKSILEVLPEYAKASFSYKKVIEWIDEVKNEYEGEEANKA